MKSSRCFSLRVATESKWTNMGHTKLSTIKQTCWRKLLLVLSADRRKMNSKQAKSDADAQCVISIQRLRNFQKITQLLEWEPSETIPVCPLIIVNLFHSGPPALRGLPVQCFSNTLHGLGLTGSIESMGRGFSIFKCFMKYF